MTNIKKKKKKKKLGISRIPFQVGNSANSATFPRSRKITGPIYNSRVVFKMRDCFWNQFWYESDIMRNVIIT